MLNSCPTDFLTNIHSLIPGIGPIDAKIAFVGEFPGIAEQKAREPFKGLAGSLLLKLMHSSGIAKSECYLTDVIKEVQQGKDVGDKFLSFKKGVQPSLEFNYFRDLLKTELDLVHANVIVAVGNIALFALCEKVGVMKWRGSILESTLLPGRKVIPIIHPNSALYKHIYQHFIAFDLARIRKQSEYSEIDPSEKGFIIGPSYYDCMAFLDRIIESYTETACDIEVMNEELSCISFTHGPDLGISIPFTRAGREYFNIPQEAAIMLKIEEVLSNRNIKKIFQNAAFDTTYLFQKYGIKTYNIGDTMIGHFINYPDFPKGLDFITSIYTDEPYYKDEGKKHFKFGGKLEDFWLYNAKDSVVCHEAMGKISHDLIKTGNLETYERQVALVEPLMAMTARGVRVNINTRQRKSDEFEVRIAQLEDELHTLAGFPLNFNSPKQLCDYFYDRKGIKAYKNRKTGTATCDSSALKRLSRKGMKEASIIMNMRTLGKRRSTYLEMPLDTDNRLRGSYNPVGTESLRLSSSKTIFDTGGNMQNLPYDVRELCEADDGYVCYQMDLSQAENRLVAYVARELTMIEAFETGKDIHKRTAALIFGKPEADISDEEGSCPIGDGSHSERFWGKKANHGLNYDFGYKSFAFMYEIPEVDAKFIVERYHTAYPGVRRYHKWVRDKLGENRTLTNIYGWNRTFLERWDDVLFKAAYSFIPQSSIGCKMNYDGVSETYYNCPFSKVELQNQIHDAIWFQIPVSAGWEYHAKALQWIKTNLESPITWGSQTFSIPVDTEMGRNYGHAHKENPEGLSKIKFQQGTSIEEIANSLKKRYDEMPKVN